MKPVRTAQRSRLPIRVVVGRLLGCVLVLYVVTLGGLFTFQRQLVFNTQHSHRTTQETHEATAPLPPGAIKVSLRTKVGDPVIAYYGRALQADGEPDPDYAHRPTLLFFYGKGSSLAGGHALLDSFRRLDANVLMPDYVGFGLSGGQESESNCYATAEACYDYLRSQPDVDQNRLFISGFSLGSGVAVNLAAQETSAHQPVAGLALFAAYTSLADEAHQLYPIYPTALLHLLLKYPFASEQKMPRVTCPVLLVHSRTDRLIPFWMSDRLAKACRGPVTRLNVDHAEHGLYFASAGKTIYPALARFMESTKSHETQPTLRRRAA